MRVYQVLRSTLLWSLQAAATHRSTQYRRAIPVSQIPIIRWPLLPRPLANLTKKSRVQSIFLTPPTSNVMLSLRAGASNMPISLLTKFTESIETSKTKSWILLILCICNETAAVTLTKKARDASDPRLMMAAYFMYVVTLFGFSLTLKQIDMSIAYAVWSALGTGIVAVAGVVLFNEVYGLKKLLCVACIIVGVAGLNLLDH
mmetsp:Transcript_9770/g.17803  ORF Transcript_9770/g.17803 Transcript_9770/m.17803 type:complete len:202 (+) Transcript_9770:38-643(+)